ncbi:glutamate-5-semialdehyde dehydrogenase [Microvirga arabica]|nr:glutamate-5-semialdehyde dehydrogenase [Microvirga arabica]
MDDIRALISEVLADYLNAPGAASVGNPDVPALMREIGRRARVAARQVALATPEHKNAALRAMAARIRAQAGAILTANEQDLAEAQAKGQPASFIDRLMLNPERLEAIAAAVESIADLPDPVGRVLARFERPNGLQIERVATPLGVVGVIFESRPNVTADAGALCLKAGNAAILRTGSESFRTSLTIAQAMGEGLEQAGLPADAIRLVPTRDRAAVGAMLSGLDGNIDVIVPRGGKSLVARVQEEARVPVFAHLEGICHVFVHAQADLDMAKAIVLNAKLRRTGVCGSAETLLVDRACAATHLKPLVAMLLDAGCAVRGDEAVQAVDPRVAPATEEDWRTEYLDAIISVRVVDGLDEAIAHIESYGSHHTDSIVTNDEAAAERFLAEVDSAIVLHNASTQFADGGEFGFGAEIGIATGRMHARGPVGVEQLTSFKYRIRGSGQTRP